MFSKHGYRQLKKQGQLCSWVAQQYQAKKVWQLAVWIVEIVKYGKQTNHLKLRICWILEFVFILLYELNSP